MDINKISKLLVLLMALMVLVIACASVWYFFVHKNNVEDIKTAKQTVETAKKEPETVPGADKKLKSFSGEQFKKLYDEFAYPNTQYISEDSVITGNKEVDLYIQKFAESRGYKRRSAPVVDVFRTVAEGIVLQERAYQPWIDLKNAGKAENVAMTLTAGYRSRNDQKTLFLEKLNINPSNYSKISSGIYDRTLTDTLSTTAIPGYSRHHNGYTIDIGCLNQPSGAFEFSVCFDWLSMDNYKNTKTYGWIPSYPEEASRQGPEPETWEYVWVGTDAVRE